MSKDLSAKQLRNSDIFFHEHEGSRPSQSTAAPIYQTARCHRPPRYSAIQDTRQPRAAGTVLSRAIFVLGYNPRQGPTNPTAIHLSSNPPTPDRALPIQLPYAFPATLSYISRRTKQQVANLTQLWLCLVTAVKLVLRTQRRRPVSVGEGFEGGRYQFA